MKKKAFVMIGILTLTLTMSVTAFAAMYNNSSKQSAYSGANCSAYGYMFDENGNFLSEEEFEAKLEAGIENNTISPDDKEFYTNMYERCTTKSSNYKNKSAGRSCH